jgi:O-methyltransferase involved in polyketide biosynthesis
VVVHIGCGLDTRYHRLVVDHPAEMSNVEWYELDLPDVIQLRRSLIPETEYCHTLAGSVFDEDWMDALAVHKGRPFLFLSEGVLVYFPEEQVKGVVLTLKERFPGCELVTDGMTPFVVTSDNLQLLFSREKARLRWKLRNPHDLERWGAGIILLDEYYYFDEQEPRMKFPGWMLKLEFIRNSVGIFHYRLE